MKVKYLLMISLCLLLTSSIVAAQYARRQPAAPGISSAPTYTAASANTVSDGLVSFLKEKAKNKQLNLVVIDPITLKQVTPPMLLLMSNERIKEMLASAHNRGVLGNAMHLMNAQRRTTRAMMRKDDTEQRNVIKERNLRTFVTFPVPRASVQGTEGRIGRTPTYADRALITDRQLDAVLTNCAESNYRGTFFTIHRATDSFSRYLDASGNPNRAILKVIINPSQNNNCVKAALRSA